MSILAAFLVIATPFSFVLAQQTPEDDELARSAIQLVVGLPTSPAREAYLNTLDSTLSANGYSVFVSVRDTSPTQERMRLLLTEEPGRIGLVLLQSMIRPGSEQPNEASALLSSPAALPDLESHRRAQLGPIGDAARAEVGEPDLFALRLWTHSTLSLVSTVGLEDLPAFAGTQIASTDPFGSEFLMGLGADVVAAPASETYSALQTGSFSGAVLAGHLINAETLSFVGASTVVPDYKIDTAAAMTSREWWLSLRAREQREILAALDAAEAAAAEAVEADSERLRSAAAERDVELRPWSTFDTEALFKPLSLSISVAGRVDIDALLDWRDETIESPAPLLQDDIDKGDNYEDGALEPARVFFATDRRYHANEPTLMDSFDNAPSPTDTVRCGEMRPARSAQPLGRVEELVRLLEGTSITSGSDACLAMISKAAASRGDKLLVFVHGFNTTFDEATRSALAFARDARMEGVVMVWSWPSLGGVRDYGYDEERIELTEPQFLALVSRLLAEKDKKGNDILAHSMGSRLVARLMRDEWPSATATIVFAAPDVYRDYLDRALRSAGSKAKVTLLATSDDKALWGSEKIHNNPRAGQAVPLYLHADMETIDLSAFDRWHRLNHGHAFTAAEVVADLSRLFNEGNSASERGLEEHTHHSLGLPYFVLEPDGS